MMAASFNRPTEPTKRSVRVAEIRSNGLNRVFAAAVVNRQFCDMLLKNPREALQKGYLGEMFILTPEEISLIASIRADTLSDLARQVYALAGTD
jgi:hypothetical protein